VHLDDTDEGNGCLRVVPGSHKQGPIEATGESHALEVPLEDGVPIPARAGDVLFFNYLTIHGSGLNTSERTRRNVLFQYRDPEDPPLVQNGVEEHVDWGMGVMVAGRNPVYWERRPRFTLKP
jgi:phytanoyl-CoA hydroxylase